MPGGKGKSTGGKAGPKEVAGKSQKSHSAKAGLQVSSVRLGRCCNKLAVTIWYTRVASSKTNGRSFERRPTDALKMAILHMVSLLAAEPYIGAVSYAPARRLTLTSILSLFCLDQD